MEKEVKKRTAGDIVRYVVMAIALCIFCYSGYQLVSIYLEYKAGTDEYSALEDQFKVEDAGILEPVQQGTEEGDQEPTMKNPIDFEGLKKINSDIIAWISVGAININYPVAQGEDNDYYLHHTFENQENIAGCIFVDYQCSKDFTDSNTIIYGHNMRNESMFGKLKKFKEEDVFNKDAFFWIYTPDRIYCYEIFGCQEVGSTSETYQHQFDDKKKFQEYIDSIFTDSIFIRDIEVTSEDKIVTLSTCTGNQATRFLVQGKLLKTYKAIQ